MRVRDVAGWWVGLLAIGSWSYLGGGMVPGFVLEVVPRETSIGQTRSRRYRTLNPLRALYPHPLEMRR